MKDDLKQALLSAQAMADRSGLRIAITEFNGEYEAVKASYCIEYGLVVLEIIRPRHSLPIKAFRNLEFLRLNKSRQGL